MKITDTLLEAWIDEFNDISSDWTAHNESGDYIIFYEGNVMEDYSEEMDVPETFEKLVDECYRRGEWFDPDEHVEMWVEARHNGVSGIPSTRELVDEADQIADSLDNLGPDADTAFEKIKELYGDELEGDEYDDIDY